jgi:AcrB/AcrD/AcrF family
MAIGIGEGGELQAPLARVVIGGLLTSTMVTLELVPAVYACLNRESAGCSGDMRSPKRLRSSLSSGFRSSGVGGRGGAPLAITGACVARPHTRHERPPRACCIGSSATTSRPFAPTRPAHPRQNGLPRFIEDEFRRFLRCGFLAVGLRGFIVPDVGWIASCRSRARAARCARAAAVGAWPSAPRTWSITFSPSSRCGSGC